MSLLARITQTLFRRNQLSADLQDEMAFHIEERTKDLVRRGVAPEEATRQAKLSFGNSALLADQSRDADVVTWLDNLVRESGQALRSLIRRPGLAGTAILSALGIGGTSAIFSVVDAVLLRPVAVPDVDRVVAIQEARRDDDLGANAARLKDYRAQTRTLESIAGYYGEDATLTGGDTPQRFSVIRSFGPLMQLLQANPQMGRTFNGDEESGAGAPVALIGNNAWRLRFDADPGIIGRTVILDGTSYTVIGILPPSFGFPRNAEFVIPARAELQNAGRRGNFFAMVGRLKPGSTVEAASAEMNTLAKGFATLYPDTDRDLTARAIPLQLSQTTEARAPLLLLLGAVVVLLLVCCVNIASLLLARAAERRHEAAVRISLGAGRGSLIRLYLIESGWLAAIGGLFGLLCAWLGVPLLRHLLPADLPRLDEAALDWRVTLFTLIVAAGCGLLFGFAPAWQASRAAGTAESLRDGGRNTAGGKRLLIRRSLVVLQVSLSMLLLVAAGLLAESLYNRRMTPTGVVPDQLLTVRLSLSWDTEPARLHRVYGEALRELAAIPGVVSVGLTDRLPLEGQSQRRGVQLERTDGPGVEALRDRAISFRTVSAEYFATAGVPITGRTWSTDYADYADYADNALGADGADPSAGVREVVVNQTFARRYLPTDRPAEGQRLSFDVNPSRGQERAWYEIVGVVADIRQSLEQEEQPAEIFVPYQRDFWPIAAFVLRTRGEPAATTAAVREVLQRVAPDQVIDRIAPLNMELADLSRDSATRAWLVAVFAGMAVLLAAIGLFGVLSSDVAQRRQEIGVRLALGADAGQVRWMMIRDGLLVSLLGLAIGTAASLGLGQVLASLLYGVTARDASAFAGAGAILFLVAFAASYLPARRAASIPPASALRQQ
jgi:predicted permease